MTGSWRYSSSAALLALFGCTETRPGIEGTTSLRVEVIAPADPGSEAARLPDRVRDVTVRVTALDERGEKDAAFAATLDVYTHFLGTLTPRRGGTLDPLTLPVSAGEGTASLTLPLAYGPTFLWVEDAAAREATFATGTSPTLWYRDPFLVDVSRPENEGSGTALERSPLEQKQVRIEASQHGADGRLVVTNVQTQGYTLSDVRCPGGSPPCVADPYAHIFVFTFGRPRSEEGAAIRIGHRVRWVSGGVGEFNGFTELNFPQTSLVSTDVDESLVPAPVVLQAAWLGDPIQLEKVESALVAVEGGEVCPLDEDYATYGQWKLDVGLGCDDPYNVITRSAISDFDPAPYVGKTLPRVVGTLRAVNIGTFHVWIVEPRRSSDLDLN